MNTQLDVIEARVIGALIEKEITTPDQYPLSLNALVNACNQKTNRTPVMALDEATVQGALDRLSRRHLVMDRSGFGSRVVKYRHRLCNGDHNPRQFTAQELAVVCELLLRGPQTPGELRSRAQRCAPFADVTAVVATLEELQTRPDGPYVVQLPRAPGSRESRYQHLFSGPPDPSAPAPEQIAPASELALEERLAALEDAVAELRLALQALRPAP